MQGQKTPGSGPKPVPGSQTPGPHPHRVPVDVEILHPKLGTEFPLPFYATDGAAGMDLCACLDEPLVLNPGERVRVPTGFAMRLPGPDWVGLIFARSGLGTRHGVALPNGVGVIDSDYRGEVQVALTNLGDTPYEIKPGERIAQLVVMPVGRVAWRVVDKLDGTARGSGGFGSTGR